MDWAKDTHEVLVADGDGEQLWASTVTHDEQGITRVCQVRVTLGVQRIAVERPDGLLVERLLDAGLTVLAIHPNKSTCCESWWMVGTCGVGLPPTSNGSRRVAAAEFGAGGRSRSRAPTSPDRRSPPRSGP